MVQLQDGANCTKFLFITFNVVLMLSGIGLTYLNMFKMNDDFGLIGGSFSSVQVLLMAAGVITTFITFFGLCGALAENLNFIRIYMVVLTIITALQIAVGILGFSSWKKVEPMFEEDLLASMKRQDTAVWERVQQDLQCCGVYGSSDWVSIAGLKEVPLSCCAVPFLHIGCNSTTSFSQGCLSELSSIVKGNSYTIGTIAIAFLFLQLIAMAIAMTFAGSLKKEYEKI